ncbi:MAG TPA: PilW family protein [Burkholderiaceae bacterium]|nr:PilW family protein [Burkholderiaceae bacterium]
MGGPVTMQRLFTTRRSKQAGLTIVELMVAMTIGLVLIGAVLAIYLSQRQTYRLTDNLGRVQESARLAFELMSRDLREAGNQGCANTKYVANVLNNANGGTPDWWADLSTPLIGYDGNVAFPGAAIGNGTAQRVTGTDAVWIARATGDSLSIASHNPPAAMFHLTKAVHPFKPGDIAVICDYQQASIFQVTGPSAMNATLVHGAGANVSPGNCSVGLGYKKPVDCSHGGTSYQYGLNAQIMKLDGVGWYIGNNGRGASGGKSLYKVSLVNNSGTTAPVASEVIEGVNDLQISYLLSGGADYVDASAINAADWEKVIAVRLSIGFMGPDPYVTTSAASSGQVTRSLTHVIALRNTSS